MNKFCLSNQLFQKRKEIMILGKIADSNHTYIINDRGVLEWGNIKQNSIFLYSEFLIFIKMHENHVLHYLVFYIRILKYLNHVKKMKGIVMTFLCICKMSEHINFGSIHIRPKKKWSFFVYVKKKRIYITYLTVIFKNTRHNKCKHLNPSCKIYITSHLNLWK